MQKKNSSLTFEEVLVWEIKHSQTKQKKKKERPKLPPGEANAVLKNAARIKNHFLLYLDFRVQKKLKRRKKNNGMHDYLIDISCFVSQWKKLDS